MPELERDSTLVIRRIDSEWTAYRGITAKLKLKVSGLTMVI